MIQLSASALKQIKRLREDGEVSPNAMLRVKVAKGGCSGLSYKLDFDEVSNSTDKVFEYDGESIVTDPQSYLYIIGMTLDYSGGLNGRGFVFVNPNATKTCSCGSSFNVKSA